MTKKRRAIYLEIVKRNVKLLVERKQHHQLLLVLEATGYIDNSSTTCAEVGAVIVALAAVISDRALRNTVENAVFYGERGDRRGRWERANAAAERAVQTPELVS